MAACQAIKSTKPKKMQRLEISRCIEKLFCEHCRRLSPASDAATARTIA
jgi:hypothetical protein